MLVIADCTVNYKLLRAYVSKLRALAFRFTTFGVSGQNGEDHFVHEMTHLTTSEVVIGEALRPVPPTLKTSTTRTTSGRMRRGRARGEVGRGLGGTVPGWWVRDLIDVGWDLVVGLSGASRKQF